MSLLLLQVSAVMSLHSRSCPDAVEQHAKNNQPGAYNNLTEKYLNLFHLDVILSYCNLPYVKGDIFFLIDVHASFFLRYIE